MAELDFISKFSGEEIDNILDKSQELLNKGYTFSGVATPETDPGTPSLKVFYLTTTAGKYADRGGRKLYNLFLRLLRQRHSLVGVGYAVRVFRR